MLTRKQHELLVFIQERLQAVGVPPSFDEMKDALDLKSKSGIHRLITALEERGFIRRLPNRARALEVIKFPEAATAPKTAELVELASVRKARHDADGATDQRVRPAESESLSIPVMGRIAAGVPISAIQQNTHSIALPADMIGLGEHYALEVKGDSMIDAGILDGDTVLIQRTDSASAGEIVVALVDDEEATLKRFRRKGNLIALEAANPAYETREFGAGRVKVQGRLVGLIRRYH